MVQHNTLAYMCECKRKGGIHYLSAKFTDDTSIQRRVLVHLNRLGSVVTTTSANLSSEYDLGLIDTPAECTFQYQTP